MNFIPVFEPTTTGRESPYVLKAIQEKALSGTSPTVGEFELRFSRWLGLKECVAVSSGTASLHASLLALGIKEGDEVIVPNLTILSDALAVLQCGATPVLVDVRPEDGCIDVDQIKRALSPKTKGIIAVHLYGNACDMDGLQSISQEKGLWILEDAAQAMGAFWKGDRLGTLGLLSCFSFYANKLITMGEGGAIATNDTSLAHKLNEIRNLSFGATPATRYIHSGLTPNYRLSGIQAAFGLGQLDGIEDLISKRHTLAQNYKEYLEKISAIENLKPDSRCQSILWTQTCLLSKAVQLSVSDVQEGLFRNGIDSRRLFYPLHAQPVLKNLVRFSKTNVSERFFERGFYLPSSSELSKDQVSRICSTLRDILAGAA